MSNPITLPPFEIAVKGGKSPGVPNTSSWFFLIRSTTSPPQQEVGIARAKQSSQASSVGK